MVVVLLYMVGLIREHLRKRDTQMIYIKEQYKYTDIDTFTDYLENFGTTWMRSNGPRGILIYKTIIRKGIGYTIAAAFTQQGAFQVGELDINQKAEIVNKTSIESFIDEVQQYI